MPAVYDKPAGGRNRAGVVLEARDQDWEMGGDGDIGAGVNRLIMGR